MDLRRIKSIFKNGWEGGTGTQCGAGSSGIHARGHIQKVKKLIEEYRIKSLGDAGCGDCNWIQQVFPSLKRYVGYDATSWDSWEEIKHRHVKLVGDFDICNDKMKKHDAIICFNVFIHLPNKMIWSAINNFTESKSKLLLVFPNRDCKNEGRHEVPHKQGNFYDLLKPPFSMQGEYIAPDTLLIKL